MTHYFFIKYRYPGGVWQVALGTYETETLAKAALKERKAKWHLSEQVKICKCWRKL